MKSMRIICLFACVIFISLFALNRVNKHILLDEVMCRKDQENTGVAYLNGKQRLALEQWLNKYFVLKEETSEPSSLYLSLNLGNGKILQLSDGSYYQVAPDDVIYSSLWIIPFDVILTQSEDPDFPLLFNNRTTGTSVRVKPLTETELQQLLNKMPVETGPQIPESQIPTRPPIQQTPPPEVEEPQMTPFKPAQPKSNTGATK